MFGLFKKTETASHEEIKHLHQRRVVTRYRVLQAINELGECNYREIADHLGIIDGSVTPRIPQLKEKGLIRITSVKKTPGGVAKRYYNITRKGRRELNGRYGL